MKDQVTSIEQSKRLIEMGVPTGKASLRGVKEFNDEPELDAIHTTNNFVIHPKGGDYAEYYEITYPAFTVADLLDIIPHVIQYGRFKKEHVMFIVADDGWKIYYTPILSDFYYADIRVSLDVNLIDALIACIEWLVSNGYKLEV